MKKSVKTFFKQNAFYLILALIICLGTVIGAIAIAKNNSNSSLVFNQISSSEESSSASEESSSKSDEPTPTPTPTVIMFSVPVKGGVAFKEFTDNTVVFNETLGSYTGHMGVDFKGEENADVLCAYDGVISSIETSYLYGTVITVDHGNSLYTTYSSLEADENLTVGQSLKTGDVLGQISTTHKQEYKDGAHLHFEVIENGVKVNPFNYLVLDEDK